jgi:hypothetical protein
MKRHLAMLPIILATSFIFVIATPSAPAQKLAGPHRPAAVPEGYVITPFGQSIGIKSDNAHRELPTPHRVKK